MNDQFWSWFQIWTLKKRHMYNSYLSTLFRTDQSEQEKLKHFRFFFFYICSKILKWRSQGCNCCSITLQQGSRVSKAIRWMLEDRLSGSECGGGQSAGLSQFNTVLKDIYIKKRWSGNLKSYPLKLCPHKAEWVNHPFRIII